MALLSVIITCYNQGQYLQDAVNSINGGMTSLGLLKKQTLQDIEIIVVNDGSSEEVPAIKGANVRRIDILQNTGKPNALNVGINEARASTITILDADDMRESTSLDKMYRTLTDNPHSYIYDDICIFSAGKRQKQWYFRDYTCEEMLNKNMNHAGIMFSKDAFLEAGGYNNLMRESREDWAFNIALISKDYCGIHIPNAGYLYRREGQNGTLRYAVPEWQNIFKERIKSIFPELYVKELHTKSGRLPMCCGRRSTRVKMLDKKKEIPTRLIGSEGMVTVEYQGDNFGSESFFGCATGSLYKFNASKRTRLVDKRDLHSEKNKTGLSDIFQHGKALFKVVSSASDRRLEKVVEPSEDTPEPEQLTYTVTPEEQATPGLPILAQILGENSGVFKALWGKGYVTPKQVLEDNTDTISAKTGMTKSAVKKIKMTLKEHTRE